MPNAVKKTISLPADLAREVEARAEAVAVFLAEFATIVSPRRRLHVVKDDPDNRVLECALTGRAHRDARL